MKIWKYKFPIDDEFSLKMADGIILDAQIQHGVPCMWVKTSGLPESIKLRRFAIIGTGHDFDARGLVYIATFQMYDGALVWHLFERISG